VTFGSQSGSSVVDLQSTGRTVGSLYFTNGSSTTIQSSGGASLTLDNAGLASGISLLGTHSVTAPIALNNDLSIQGPGTLSISGGIAANNYNVTVGSQSTVNLTGGTLDGPTVLNAVAGGTLRIANSTVTMASDADGVFAIGYGTTGTGTVIVDGGGVLNIGNGGCRTFVGGGPDGGPYGDGVLTVNSGGEVNVAAEGAFPNEALYVGGYGGNGTINLNGGTLASARVIHGAHGTRVFNFNGGTLKAEMDAGTGNGFLYGMTAVNIQAGGAIIDTNRT